VEVYPKIVLMPSSGPSGTVIQIQATGFGSISGTPVDIIASWGYLEKHSTETFYYGSFSYTLTVPEGLYNSDYTIACMTPDGLLHASQLFRVTDASIPEPEPNKDEAKPKNNIMPWVLGATAVALIATGMLLTKRVGGRHG
jgi:hypothetical protein